MSTRDRTLIMVAIVAALAVGSWMLLLKPQREQAAELQTQVETAQTGVDAATARAAEATAARLQYERDYATIVRLGKAVPDDDDVASLVYQIDTSAEKTGVDFRSVSVSENGGPAGGERSGEDAATGAATPTASDGGQTLAGNVTTVPFTMTFTGGFFQMTRFLREVQRYTSTRNGSVRVRGRLVSIDSVTLTPQAGSLSKVKAEVTATAYRAPVEPVGQAAPSGTPTPAAGGSGASPTTASVKKKTPPTAAAGVVK